MLETLLITERFGLVHLPLQLHSIFSGQHGELLPRPAPPKKQTGQSAATYNLH